ncbi:MAG: hypothetical protein V3V08_14010 [Nannocystaceae bacterium]
MTTPRPKRWRSGLRALHRDAGYVAVGLTLVYAVSGLAVNHIGEWDPNFNNFERQVVLEERVPGDAHEAATVALARLGIASSPRDVYRAADGSIEITLDRSTVFIQPDGTRIIEQGQRPRVLLRLANWLHLNRGKRAWTYIADGYAVLLIGLAVSGVFMLPGPKRIIGRRGVLIGLGILVPVVYVACSGGPGG